MLDARDFCGNSSLAKSNTVVSKLHEAVAVMYSSQVSCRSAAVAMPDPCMRLAWILDSRQISYDDSSWVSVKKSLIQLKTSSGNCDNFAIDSTRVACRIAWNAFEKSRVITRRYSLADSMLSTVYKRDMMACSGGRSTSMICPTISRSESTSRRQPLADLLTASSLITSDAVYQSCSV